MTKMTKKQAEVSKNNVQGISFFIKPHPIHEAWMKSVSSRKTLPYVPKFLLWTKKFPIASQLISLVSGIFNAPFAGVFVVEGVGTVPFVFFRPGKVVCINSDTFFYNLEHSSWLVRTYSKLLLKRIDGFISTSSMMQIQQAKYANKPSQVVYPFMEKQKLFKMHPKFENNNICNIAGMRYTKGTDILVDVFKKYKQIHKNAQLFSLGWEGGDIKTDWKNKVEEAGGIAPGFVPSEEYYKESSIYINPARHEPFGVNVIEAMAAGIPPLVSEHCGSSDVVKKVSKELIIPLKSDEIVKKIVWLKSNKERYLKLSKRCKIEAKKLSKKESVKDFKIKFANVLGMMK
ncbi:glycosyltransferase [Candidatus Woesearchaeota archaeon]|nr:glycosyltransferase [Candidatus Woesearchaeota archaeon]